MNKYKIINDKFPEKKKGRIACTRCVNGKECKHAHRAKVNDWCFTLDRYIEENEYNEDGIFEPYSKSVERNDNDFLKSWYW